MPGTKLKVFRNNLKILCHPICNWLYSWHTQYWVQYWLIGACSWIYSARVCMTHTIPTHVYYTRTHVHTTAMTLLHTHLRSHTYTRTNTLTMYTNMHEPCRFVDMTHVMHDTHNTDLSVLHSHTHNYCQYCVVRAYSQTCEYAWHTQYRLIRACSWIYSGWVCMTHTIPTHVYYTVIVSIVWFVHASMHYKYGACTHIVHISQHCVSCSTH